MKYQVVIPKDILKNAGWIQGEGEEISWPGDIAFNSNVNGRIILAKSINQTIETEKIDYCTFRQLVHQRLSLEKQGLTYAELRERDPNLPKSPAAIWIRQLEADVGLVRIPNPKGKIFKKIWRLQ